MLSLFLFLAFVLPFAPFEISPDVTPAGDGVPIHYTVQSKGEPALVFIHCWSCDRHLWDNQVPVFAKNHRVVTIDLPGHGESGKDRKEWSIATFGDDVTRVVTKLGLKRVILVGSSMGGPIVLEATRRMPERVVAIVAVDTLHNVDDKLPAETVDAMLKQIRADYKGATARFMNQMLFAPSTPTAVKDRVIAQATSRPPEIAIGILEAVLAYNSAAALREVKVPIRAINAELSPTNLEVNRKYAPQFDVVIMKGVGHYPMLEDSARFNQLLAEALQNFRSASGSKP